MRCLLPSSASTQLKLRLRLALFSNKSSHPTNHTSNRERRLKCQFQFQLKQRLRLSLLSKQILLPTHHPQKTISRLIQFYWASTQFPLKLWAWHYSAPACFIFFLFYLFYFILFSSQCPCELTSQCFVVPISRCHIVLAYSVPVSRCCSGCCKLHWSIKYKSWFV